MHPIDKFMRRITEAGAEYVEIEGGYATDCPLCDESNTLTVAEDEDHRLVLRCYGNDTHRYPRIMLAMGMHPRAGWPEGAERVR